MHFICVFHCADSNFYLFIAMAFLYTALCYFVKKRGGVCVWCKLNNPPSNNILFWKQAFQNLIKDKTFPTLFEVFRIGTSFSELILASISSHVRSVFWNRILTHTHKGYILLTTNN